MAVISNSRRAGAGIALVVAGALFLLGLLLPYIGISLTWLFPIAYLALGVALIVLALGAVNSTLTKIALFVGAVGWIILALAAFTTFIPAQFVTLAAILAGLGLLIGAILLYVGKEIANTAALVFVIAAILGVFFLLNFMGTFALGNLSPLVTGLFGAALVVAGVLFRRVWRR
jgi:hypothetical protein